MLWSGQEVGQLLEVIFNDTMLDSMALVYHKPDGLLLKGMSCKEGESERVSKFTLHKFHGHKLLIRTP